MSTASVALWSRPGEIVVRVGVEKRESSKGDRGIVTVETKGFNQDGTEVCYFRRKVMVWKAGSAPVRHRPYDGQDPWAE